ncbi:MAG: hypothetical protein AAF682_11640 [Planctomycetota bacterium]
MRCLPLLFFLVTPAAAQIYVPGDYSNLQAAVNAAAPEEVILVSGIHESVVVKKPLTILGNPTFTITSGCASTCFDCPPDDNAFRLQGGGGRLVLGGFTSQSMDCNYPAPVLGGGGYDEVHLLDATIQIQAGQSGLGHGASAIDVDVPYLLVSGSTIAASGSDSDHCSGFLYNDEATGIKNPGGMVMLVGSTVRGGDGGQLCCVLCACPDVEPSMGGIGGDGVVADAVYLAGSTVDAGVGATFLAYPAGKPYLPAGTPTACATQPSGIDILAATVEVLGGPLSGPSRAPVGGAYTLEWELPGPGAFLLFSLGLTEPRTNAYGVTLLDRTSMIQLGILTTGTPSAKTYPVPPLPELIGAEFGFQAWDASLGLTWPAVGVFAP